MNRFLIRLFDFLFSIFGLIIFSPIFILIIIFIKVDSKGPVFFLQRRVGKGNTDFSLYKFRTMYLNADKIGLITVGENDPRITKTGAFLRKYKLDEFPQFINVLYGQMSLVGPRPEVRRYTELYNASQKIVLSVKPGITDIASIEYSNENELLAKANDPEDYYVKEIIPAKIRLNLFFIQNPTFANYLRIILRTIGKILSH